ncbi:MAG: hypothetical protein F4Y45_07195 [Acidobacteria bacterium]|nr:hypothetical protein [Acidobacteriota bacterium]MYD70815.1 hypothetical protein [Acidobacteriota bacterium]MYJ06286.1 hypothetical protein [Acidobacteriota bacterium]
MAPAVPATAVPAGLTVMPRAASTASAVMWPLWAVAFASTSVIVGGIWDISWHRTIGRDTFWTPAHLAIYLGGIVAGLSCGWIVIRATFGRDPSAEEASGVRFWGFRGPLGAWVCIWGSLAMIVSAPFDDWWHNAYGLDVEILSPPHVVLALGIYGIGVGAMLMALARQNGASATDRMLQLLFLYAGGLQILMVATLFTEYLMMPNAHHSPPFFYASAAVFPCLLVAVARGALSRWGATGAAGVYMGVTLLMIWILQLFPAQPMLAPILRQVDHMVPPAFPLLLVVPALAIDIVVNRIPAGAGRIRQALIAVVAGVAAMLALTVVQWPFASFLLTEPARNFFFAADQFGFDVAPGPFQYEFWGAPMTAGAAGWTGLIAAVSAVAGLVWGNWMARVRR